MSSTQITNATCAYCRKLGHSVHTCPKLLAREKEAEERCQEKDRIERERKEYLETHQEEIEARAAAYEKERVLAKERQREEYALAKEREVAQEREATQEREAFDKFLDEYFKLPEEKKIEISLQKAKGIEEAKCYTYLDAIIKKKMDWGDPFSPPYEYNVWYYRFIKNGTESEIIEVICDIRQLLTLEKERKAAKLSL